MTASPVDLPPLTTDEEVLARVRTLIGAACRQQLWLLFVDGDGKQSPVLVPISDIPRHPDRRLLEALTQVLHGLRGELVTERGPGAVIVVCERYGTDALCAADREWAAALAEACRSAGVVLRAAVLSTPGGVRWLG